MSLRWSEDDLKRVINRREDPRNITPERRVEIARLGGQARQAKYRNQPTVVDGIRFASKKEADYNQQLLFMKAGNAIKGFTRQVSIRLPSSKRRMVIDFVVVELDDRVRWIDVKGIATEAWKIKRDEAEHMLGIKIETV